MHDGRTRKVDLVEPGKSLAFLEAHRASLTMVSGSTAGSEFALEGARSVAGRSSKAQIQLDDGSVSLEHAAFELDGHGFGVRDLASTNGVQVNGKPVLSAALQHGDRVRLGDCELLYVVEERTRPLRTWSVEEDA
ncbi:MAG: hypothetical protein CL908_02040 [Deltaproteobacteria bacterium]|nr:hypothetical protein [Deltaproteobacteria bacterium]